MPKSQPTVPAEPRREIRYVALGAHADLMRNRGKRGEIVEELLEGPRGTGKSRCLTTRTHERCKANPGYRVLWLRKTAASLKRTILPGFELDVAPRFPWKNPGATVGHRDSYLYPNGSEIILSGMDNPLSLRSGEFDELNYFEAHESTLNQWEEIAGSIRRFGAVWCTMAADTNPAHKGHYLWKRSRAKRMRIFRSRHWMNPKFFNPDGTPTPEGQGYVLGTLANLTGTRRSRLFLGWWVAQGGAVWETFDEAVNVKRAREVPGWHQDPAKRRPLDWYFASVDWGFKHAGVIQVWGVRKMPPPVRFEMYRVGLVYRTEKQLDWWARAAKVLTNRYPIVRFVCDPARKDAIATFNTFLGRRDGAEIAIEADNRHANRGVEGQDMGGIDTVRWALRDSSGITRMFFVEPDEAFLQDPDPDDPNGEPMGGPDKLRLEQAKPVSDVEEIPDYRLAESKDGDETEWVPDRPAEKQDDDGCDSTRYAAVYANTHDFSSGPEPSRFPPMSAGALLGHEESLNRDYEEDEE